MIPVVGWSLSVVTAPPPGGPAFGLQVSVRLNTGAQGTLNIRSIDEFMAITAMLQIPGGQLFFNPAGQSLIKTA